MVIPVKSDLDFENNASILNAGVGGGGGGIDMDFAEVYRNANQSIANGGVIDWDTLITDTNGLTDIGGANPSRLTIQKTGRYSITTSTLWVAATHAGTFSAITIYLNGTTNIAGQKNYLDTNDPFVHTSYVGEFTAGDYIEVRLLHNDGGTIDIQSTGNYFTRVSIAQLPEAEGGGGGSSVAVRGEAERTLSVQSLTTGDSIEWDTEISDDDNFIDVGGGNPERITINTNGRYLITAFVPLDASTHTGTESNVNISKNGSVLIAAIRLPNNTGNSLASVTTVADLVATDFITIDVGHDDGGTIDTVNLAAAFPRVTIDKIGGGGSGGGSKTLLTANTTFYVDPAGNDANDGLTIGTPKLTIQAMLDDLRDNYDAQAFDVTIQLANGTYDSASGPTILARNIQNANRVTIQGDIGGNNTLVTISNTDATDFVACIRYPFNEGISTFYRYKDLTLSNTTKAQGDCLSIFAYAQCKLINVRISAVPTGPGFVAGISAGSGGIVHIVSLEIATSSPDLMFYAENNGLISALFSTITFTGGPSWTNHFASVIAASVDLNGASLVNTATGSRGLADLNGVLRYSGATAMGNSGPTTSNGGVTS